MENLGDIDRQTIAGSISTGTHGTGAGLRNISSQVDGDRARPRRRQRPRARRRRRPAARRAGRDRRARRDLRGDAALRPGLHPRPGRPPAAARGGARQLPGARRRPRPLRALHLPLRRHGPGPRAQPDRGAAEAARPGRRVPQRRRPRELGAGGDLRRRQVLPEGHPAPSPGSPPGSPRAAGRSTAATGSSPTSAGSASPRWSTACRARTAPRRRGG